MKSLLKYKCATPQITEDVDSGSKIAPSKGKLEQHSKNEVCKSSKRELNAPLSSIPQSKKVEPHCIAKPIIKKYSCLDCDCSKENSYFSIIHLPSCYRTVQ